MGTFKEKMKKFQTRIPKTDQLVIYASVRNNSLKQLNQEYEAYCKYASSCYLVPVSLQTYCRYKRKYNRELKRKRQ